jgi:hypothetical protein
LKRGGFKCSRDVSLFLEQKVRTLTAFHLRLSYLGLYENSFRYLN